MSGKLKWVALDTDIFSVAELRMAEETAIVSISSILLYKGSIMHVPRRRQT